MNISCHLSRDWDDELPKALSAIRKASCDGVEIDLRKSQTIKAVSGDAFKLAHQLRKHGLCLSGCRIADMAVDEVNASDKYVAPAAEQMRLAHDIGAKSVFLCAGDRRYQSIELFMFGIQKLIPLADDLGLVIQLANRLDSRIEQIEDLRRVADLVLHSHMRFLIDIGQFHAAAVNPRDVIAEFAGLIGDIRISDRKGRDPMPIGQGEINLGRIIEQVNRISPKGGWSLPLRNSQGLIRSNTC